MLVTGGAGYVGSALVPHLLKKGHHVTVLDLYAFGEHALNDVRNHVNLSEIKGDIRNLDTIKKVLKGCNAVIHLAGASNENRLSINSKNDEFSVKYETPPTRADRHSHRDSSIGII